ncbi:interleukin-17C [Terrapene carolina triunguis]|uniref:interleukin-17C n=1 Tax=Terrapene triunguis TaxID=2587831 RepID=UPI00115651B1|nr:interleukin-17C [Terrapene carolina triunguis]
MPGFSLNPAQPSELQCGVGVFPQSRAKRAGACDSRGERVTPAHGSKELAVSSACFSQEQLQAGELPTHFVSRTMKWDRYAPVQLVPHLEKMQQEGGQRRKRQVDGCPALQLQATVNSEPNERSLSPWRYRIDEDENRYPQKLAFAECLCTGCIDVKTGRETSSLNSVLMHQTMMVLRRKPCPHNASPGTFAFEVEYIKVPVGCTCVLPRSSG